VKKFGKQQTQYSLLHITSEFACRAEENHKELSED
jgi:hypothetical protein